MKKFIFYSAAATTIFLGNVFAQPSSQHNLVRTAESFNEEGRRACIFPAGGWTTIDCSNAAAATSAQLNAWSQYIIQCGDDSYLATGDEATDVADANDGFLSAEAWLKFATTDSIRYMSCLNVTIDSDCRYIECR